MGENARLDRFINLDAKISKMLEDSEFTDDAETAAALITHGVYRLLLHGVPKCTVQAFLLDVSDRIDDYLKGP